MLPMTFSRLFVLMQVLRVCFFFQAEDGIRDVAVTGVQTCALPISKNLILFVARLQASQQQIILLIVQARKPILRMLQKYPPEPGLDFGVAVVGVWELFTDGREQVVRPLQAFLFRDPQHVGKVALEGSLDGLRALDMLQIPDAEAHQGCRREHDSQLQRQERSRAFCQSQLLGHSGASPDFSRPYEEKTIKTSSDKLSTHRK